MDHRNFNNTINSDQPVVITAEIMAAAHQSAHRERSAAIRQSMQWLKRTTGALFARSRGNGSEIPSGCTAS